MKKLLFVVSLIILCCVGIVWAANVKWTALSELTTPAGGDILCIVDDPAGTPVSKKITRDNLIGNWTGSANITTLGTIGTGTWSAGAVTSSGVITATTSVISPLLDAAGAEDMDYGSVDVLDHTFTTNDCTFIIDGGITVSTGDSIVLGTTTWNSADGIDGEVIINDTIDNDSIDWGDMTDLTTDGAVSWGNIAAGELADDTVNDDDINWADLTYLTTNGAGINEAYASGWNADVGPPEKDDIYDYLHLIDADDDGSLVDEGWYTTQSNTIDFSGATLTMPSRTANDDRYFSFNVWNPNAVYDTDTQICIEPNLPANITITEVTITLDADPTTELDWDLKWADAFIGLANATLIEPIDTTSGTIYIASGFDDATVVAGKCLYIEFAADPDSNIKQAMVKIKYDYD